MGYYLWKEGAVMLTDAELESILQLLTMET